MNYIKTIKKMVCILMCCCICAFIVHKLGYIFRPIDTDGAHNQIETLHSLPDYSLEVIVYGSSHAFRGISTMEMYDKFGIGAYNYGWHWQRINTTKAFLKDSLLKQKPKVALIEAGRVGDVLKDTYVTPEVYYSRYLYDEQAKEEFLHQCLGKDISFEKYITYFMPLIMFHDNWNTLTKRNFIKLKDGENEGLKKNMGFSPSDEIYPIEIPDYSTFEQLELDMDSYCELEEIVDICHSRDIEVVFFTVPWDGEYYYHDAMKKFADDNDCAYIDFFEYSTVAGLDGLSDFSDGGHLNQNGAIKVADFIGEYLVNHYDLTDMRKARNNIWKQ